ncbi:WD repeat domain phosphoinositide-interacting protein 2-like [Uloborus diversus]|uniref:WD repeat domain phosphoinositide-interacting protein 2-like n=1 Tax=Uloborus diversus TaxID=327109 RepID=UPI002408FB18|nr:WD repeat domain phosphoinositide-interacting protein 2-like [Uloborus diversus]
MALTAKEKMKRTLTVGSKNGYMIYDLDQVYECSPTYESRNIGDICIIERNYTSSLVAYVSLHSPRSLVFYNYAKGAEIAEKLFPNTVLSVKLNREFIAVCLEDSIYIISLKNINDGSMHAITNIPTNVKGLCSMTSKDSPTLIAYPCSCTNGHVQIFDATKKKPNTTIPAHASPLAALTFDDSGQKLATASVKGTVIRIFSLETDRILFEFRRGVKRYAEIYCLSFDINSQFLCASSNTETVHIFKLSAEETVEPYDEESESWMDKIGKVLTVSAQYLPAQMSDVFTQQRSFAYVHLPFCGQKTVCAISVIKNQPYVMVASLEGILYIYELNTEVGGACQLVKQHRIEGPLQPYMVPCSCFSSKSDAEIKEMEGKGRKESVSQPIHFDEMLPDKPVSVTATNELPPILNTVE